jgi:SAM-dependent methyltransferase
VGAVRDRAAVTRAFYEAGYSLTGEAAARAGRWRAIGARSKAKHVTTLCARAGLQPRTLVEIGCGDGALLQELAPWAPVLDGFELSPTAATYARERNVARRVEAFDGTNMPVADGAYDLAVLSHVIEHVPQPVPLLSEAARAATYVFVEVPLENNRSGRRPKKRRLAEQAGHVHSLNRASLNAMLNAAGLRPVVDLTDALGYRHHAFRSGAIKGGLKWGVRRALHRLGAAERLITLHYAVLARRA